MPESALLTKILNDFLALRGQNTDGEKLVLENFCGFAAQWLVNNGCLGLGHASSGLTLRFSDGAELALFSVPAEGSLAEPAVAISGTKTKLAVNTPKDSTNSVQITGR